jgi:hypothetical protein
MHKSYYISFIGLVLLILLAFPPESGAAGENLSVEFQTGFFVPDNHAIMGEKLNIYDSEGNIHTVVPEGFGSFFEFRFGLNYHLSSWALRLDFGRKLAVNGPTAGEKEVLASYGQNRMEIYPTIINISREVSSGESKFIPYAGFGAGVYYLRWYEKYIIQDSEPNTTYYTSDTKTLPGYNFLMGIKYRLPYNLSLKTEFSYDYAAGDVKVAYFYNNLNRHRVNIGGSSFRIGIIYKIL